MAKSIRIFLFLLLVVWAIGSLANLQLRPIPGYYIGGSLQFTSYSSRGWPRIDALTERTHSVQIFSSIDAPWEFEETVEYNWCVTSLVIDTIFSIVLLMAVVYCGWKIIFNSGQIRFSISTSLVIVATVAVTLTLFMNEREIHGSGFGICDPLLSDFSARSFHWLAWNDRAFVTTGVFLTTFLFMRYIVSCLWEFFVSIAIRSTKKITT